MAIIKYKGYEGTADLDMDRMVCRGKILFIDDLVTYEAPTAQELKKEFEAAVNDYLETCDQLGRKPKKPLKGLFQVRIPPELHEKAVLRATSAGVKLNEIMVRALDSYVNVIPQAIINNHNSYQVTVASQDPSWKFLSSVSPEKQMEVSRASH